MNMQMKPSDVLGYRNALLVITATRSWVRAIMAKSCQSSRNRDRFVGMWNDCFEQFGDPELANIWGSFMRHLTIEGRATFLLGCSGCGRNSEDENLLLNCLSAHQQGEKIAACDVLERWFEGEALWKADALAEAFSDQLSLHGFTLPRTSKQATAGCSHPSEQSTRKLN